MSELALCPFCGGKADFECVEGPTVDAKSWTVGCNERDKNDDSVICYGYQSFTTFPTKKMAAEAWNRRAGRAPLRPPYRSINRWKDAQDLRDIAAKAKNGEAEEREVSIAARFLLERLIGDCYSVRVITYPAASK